MTFKVGDVVKVVESYVEGQYDLRLDSIHTVKQISDISRNLNLGNHNEWWRPERFVLVSSAVDPEKYAAAFNMWQNDYIADPQGYEDSQTTAIRHLTEKINGEEPSYGAVAAQMFQEYLNKLESK